jgi:hypothetical protein
MGSCGEIRSMGSLRRRDVLDDLQERDGCASPRRKVPLREMI